MKVDVLLGLQWGDEGKGKVVDVLTPRYDVVARFQGGPNAGHTLEFEGRKYVLRSIPSGIFQHGQTNIIGNGVVLDPVLFREEAESLERSGVDLRSILKISKKVHLIMPTHRLLDAANERAKGGAKIGLTGSAKLRVTPPGSHIKLGCFEVEFIHVNHSIADSVALALHTPGGVLVHTGDFKIDCTPEEGEMIDLARFAELGKEGVLALLMDSTNAERPGYTQTEQTVTNSLDNLFMRAEGKRIIVATFASSISRVQMIINCAVKYGRKVALSGRSMVNVMGIASELGYLDIPDGVLVDLNLINRYEPGQLVLITTGSQGEPMSALTRMAFSDHRQVAIGPGDFIILSARPIPGNEKTVGAVVDELLKQGCTVIYESMYEVHVSGHACQEELKLIHGLVKPRFFIPVHGEQKHLQKHAGLAMAMGMDRKDIFIGEIGSVLELHEDRMKQLSDVPAGSVMVDGLGVGDVGSVVLRDRKHLAEDGLIVAVCSIESDTGHVAAGPDIVSRGFVYVRENEPLMEEARRVVYRALEDCADHRVRDWADMKQCVKDELSKFLYKKTQRNPMILPIIMEV